nr:hypothetical protein [Chromobacterium sp. ASV5]
MHRGQKMRYENVANAISVFAAAWCLALPANAAPKEAQGYAKAYALSAYCVLQNTALQLAAQGDAKQAKYKELADQWQRKYHESAMMVYQLAHEYATRMQKEDGGTPEVSEVVAWSDILTLPGGISLDAYAAGELRRDSGVCERP